MTAHLRRSEPFHGHSFPRPKTANKDAFFAVLGCQSPDPIWALWNVSPDIGRAVD